MLAATPTPLPDPSTLADLDPAVAVTFLVASVIFALLLYFGGAIRDRITPPKPDPAPPAGPGSVGQHALAPAPGAAVDRAEQRTDQFIDTLLRQLAEGAKRENELEQEVRRMQQEIRRLEMMSWRDPR